MRVIIVLLGILLSSISIIHIHNHILIIINIISTISKRRCIHHRLWLNILLIWNIINWLYRRGWWRIIGWWWYYFLRYILLNSIAMIIVNIIILLSFIHLYHVAVRFTLLLLLSRWRGQYLWHILINRTYPVFIDIEKWSWKKELSLLKYKACF